MNRMLAAVLGGFILSLAAPLFVATYAPFGLQGNLTLAILIALPTWLASIIRVFILETAGRAWLELLGLAALLFIAAVIRIQFFGIAQV